MKEKLDEAMLNMAEAVKHLENLTGILCDLAEEIKTDTKKDTDKDKVKIQIKVAQPFKEVADLDDKEMEQLRKDLEEIINDFTGK